MTFSFAMPGVARNNNAATIAHTGTLDTYIDSFL